MNNKSGAVQVPVTYGKHESQPLLDNKYQQPNVGCTRGVLCKRCLAGTHENTTVRTFLRRLIIIFSLLWFFFTIHHWVLGFAADINDDCLHHLIPWNGPSAITSDNADSIDVSFGEGDIYSTVEILTRDDVVQPTVYIDAWVTRNYDKINDKVVGGGRHPRPVRGLEVEVTEVDGWVKVFLESEDNKGRRDRRYKKKFCAKVDIKIVFPTRLQTYNRLVVGHALQDVDVRGSVSQIAFESLHLSSTIGNIVLHDLETKNGGNGGGVQAKTLHLVTITGSIHVAATSPVSGHPLSLTFESTVGSIKFNATTNPIQPVENKTPEELRHSLLLKTTTGHIQAAVRPGAGYADTGVMKKDGTIPGDIFVSGESFVGHIETDFVMAPGQVLHQELTSNMGSVESIVTDNYLGSIDVRTELGSASVTEASNSTSSIKYEKYTKTVKVGRKTLTQGGRSGSGEERGVMVFSSTNGSSRLTFVPV
ncbi:hypothetical protein BGZ95_002281 [Linnemannia exigua]|uniref:Uncharacterized protein n=1 Tax=Linnemannia exigua TaxID=604196 RepID=A0AAD4DIJ6_9FUNG|nr:hypothetical protein BGZ95_002281 [Linnemannia exigua]